MSKVLSRSILSQVGSAVSELNRSFLVTITHLTYQPRKVVNSYLSEANSTVYINPFRYLFVITSMYLLVASWLGFDLSRMLSDGSREPIGIAPENISILENSIVFLAFISWIPTSWVMSKLMKSSHKSSGDCYSIALYIEAQILLGQGLVGLPMVYFWLKSYTALSLLYLAFIPFVAWSYKQVFELTWFATVWKTLLIQLTNFLFQMLIILILGFGLGVSQAIGELDKENIKAEKVLTSKSTKN